MGITREQIVDRIVIRVTYPSVYVNKDGSPVVFAYPFRVPTQDDLDAGTRRRLGQASANRETLAVDLFAKILDAPPTGFDDFPTDDRDLEVRAKEYFKEPRVQRFAVDAINQLSLALAPREYTFRPEDDDEAPAHADVPPQGTGVAAGVPHQP